MTEMSESDAVKSHHSARGHKPLVRTYIANHSISWQFFSRKTSLLLCVTAL